MQTGYIASPAEIRYKERILLPVGLNHDAGSVVAGVPLKRAIKKPSDLNQLKEIFAKEKFLLSFKDKQTDMVLRQDASGEDVVRGWLLSAYAAKLVQNSMEPSVKASNIEKTQACVDAYVQMESKISILLSGLKEKGWHTDLFLEGAGERAVW